MAIENISIFDLLLIKKGFKLDYNHNGYSRQYSKDINYNNVAITMKINYRYSILNIYIYKNDTLINEIIKEQPNSSDKFPIDYFTKELNTYFKYLGI